MPKPVEVKKKKDVIAKSIVVFDVKVYEQETDLNVLAQKIFSEVTMDGYNCNLSQIGMEQGLQNYACCLRYEHARSWLRH
jgi:hypothetical protein